MMKGMAMNTRTRMIAVAVVAGGLGLGALTLISPAVANTVAKPFTANSIATGKGGGYGVGNGAGRGAGSQGQGLGQGEGSDHTEITAEQGTLTDAQRSQLAALAQDEQLAHDLYAAFADRYDVAVFDRIAISETEHLTSLRTLMDRYAITDPTKGQPAGAFTNATVQATYDRLLAEGSASEQAAFGVGVTVEQLDIDDLSRARDGLTAPDATQVYTILAEGSNRHLTAFERQASR
jgi:hypothetical protein